jgi:hypothetical protein
MALDKRSLKILTDMFWSTSGWKRDRSVKPDDFAYAKSHGVMFDPITLSHDQAVDAAVGVVSVTTREAVVRAFVSSLGSRRLDLRSAMGSYAVGRHLRVHRMMPSRGSPQCGFCGGYEWAEEPNVLNFERIKWGGVRHAHPRYIALDLQLFAVQEPAVPTKNDYSILRAILGAARSLAPSARLGDLEKAVSKLLPSNSPERRTLIGILGYAGILVDPGRPDFREQFVPATEREHTPWHKDDWPYPVQWWNGSHGVNEAAVAEWFPASEDVR